MIKKVIIFIALIIAGISSENRLYAGKVEENYDMAVKYINNYEFEIGYKSMSKIAGSSAASEDLRVKSYFWMAYIELIDDKEDNAREVILSMLGDQIGYEYNIEQLPQE